MQKHTCFNLEWTNKNDASANTSSSISGFYLLNNVSKQKTLAQWRVNPHQQRWGDMSVGKSNHGWHLNGGFLLLTTVLPTLLTNEPTSFHSWNSFLPVVFFLLVVAEKSFRNVIIIPLFRTCLAWSLTMLVHWPFLNHWLTGIIDIFFDHQPLSNHSDSENNIFLIMFCGFHARSNHPCSFFVRYLFTCKC